MAIGYARLEFVKRSSGKNMITKSAYAGKLRLEFEGNRLVSANTYDWTGPDRGEKPISHAVLLPEHASKEFEHPQNLWNAVEKFEKRKDSQVGYELLIALPDDNIITNDQRTEMAHRFAEKYFISKGYGVQVDVHPPCQRKSYIEEENDGKNEKNYHAHLLITPRPFTEDGTSFSEKKTNDLLPEVRGSNRFAVGGLEWPKIWTQFQNDYFEECGLDLRVDQPGINPQIHLGPVRMRGKRAYEILDLNENRQDISKLMSMDPDNILKKLTENKSVFTKSDVEFFLHKNIESSEISQVREEFWKSEKIVQLFDKRTHQATAIFSTMEVIEEEKKILRLADRIHQQSAYKTKLKETTNVLSGEQQLAFDQIISGKALSFIEGLAGTGKSFLLAALKDHYTANGYKVRGFGPDSATVKVLKEKGFTEVCNVHHHLFKNYFSNKKSVTGAKKGIVADGKEVWIVDESSKLGNRPLLELLKLAEAHNIQIIFSGNSAQHTSVDRGGMFSVFCNHYGYSLLQDIRRQRSKTDREISKCLAFGDVLNAVDMIARTGGFIWCKNKDQAIFNLVQKWAEDSIDFPCSSQIIIAQTNNEVRQVNDLIHALRMSRGEVANKEFECVTIFGNIRVSEGDFIEFRENHKKLNVTNGEKGVLISATEDKFIVSIDGRKVTFNPKKYASFQLAYATTNYRSQGATMDRSYLLYNPQMNQKLLYIGRSRHVQKCHCFVAQTDAWCLMDLKRKLIRKVGLESNTVHYTTEADIEKLKKKQIRSQAIQEMSDSDSLFLRAKGQGLKLFDSFVGKIGSIVEHVQDRKSNQEFYRVPNRNGQTQSHVVEVKEETIVSRSTVLDQMPVQVIENTASEKRFEAVLSAPVDQVLVSEQKSQTVEVKEEKITPETVDSVSPVENISSEEAISQDRSVDSKTQERDKAKSTIRGDNNSYKLSDRGQELYKSYLEKSRNCSMLHAIVKSESQTSSISKERTGSYEKWQKACGERNLAAYDLLKSEKKLQAVLGKKGLDILQDQSYRHEQSKQPKDSIDTQLNENIESLLYKLFPDGPQRKDARGFRFGSKGSLAVTCVGEKKGSYYDFERKEGGSLLTLIQRIKGLDYREARTWASEFLGEYSGKKAPSHFSTARFKEREDSWISLAPPITTSPPPIRSLSRYLDAHYKLSDMYPYHNQDGNVLFYTLRLESKGDGKKIVLPLSYGKSHPDATPSWNFKRYNEGKALLYNEHLISKDLEKPIVIVEGEKTANAAQQLLGKEYIVVSWLGGSSAAKEANWSRLCGRDVIIWPDNDEAGYKAAVDIEHSLKVVGINSLKVIDKETLHDFPQKWDLADPLPEGKATNFVMDSILRSREKAISMNRINMAASRSGISFEEMNKIVCSVDQQIRRELEKNHGFKTREIEAAILGEAMKVIPEISSRQSTPNNMMYQKSVQKESAISMGLEM